MNILRVAGPPLFIAAFMVLLWHAAVTLSGVQPFLMPGPLNVSSAIVANGATLAHAAGLTAVAAVLGLAASFVAGFLIAVSFSQSPIVERSLYPYAIFLQTVPIVAIAPLIVLWIGHGLPGVVAVSFIISLFPIIANTTAGLTRIDPDLLDLFRLYGASRVQTLLRLRVPHAIPSMLTGLRISCGLSVVGAIVGEFFAGYGTEDYGLGYLIILTNAQTKTPYLFASVLTSTALGLSFFALVSLLSRRALRRWGGANEPARA
ncbi:MAG: ABC transporter permease [Candidatus Latescibacterota bacterium]|nr:ABC transporter permease [Candidatus Latescibacterota bacterium]